MKSYGNHGNAGANFSFTSQRITLRACFTEDERAVFTAECTVSFATMNQTISQATIHIISGCISGDIVFVIFKTIFNLLEKS